VLPTKTALRTPQTACLRVSTCVGAYARRHIRICFRGYVRAFISAPALLCVRVGALARAPPCTCAHMRGTYLHARRAANRCGHETAVAGVSQHARHTTHPAYGLRCCKTMQTRKSHRLARTSNGVGGRVRHYLCPLHICVGVLYICPCLAVCMRP